MRNSPSQAHSAVIFIAIGFRIAEIGAAHRNIIIRNGWNDENKMIFNATIAAYQRALTEWEKELNVNKWI
ncbi:MAG: hypothetical protein K9I94_13360 [Bacteroidales bacterium]|nr:hypothetical protein [Bacteroidales bacterium]